MGRILQLCALLTAVLCTVQPLLTHPEFLNRFQNDPFRRPEVDGCAVCHINKEGGGVRNEFGAGYAGAGGNFTPLLRSNWPDRFNVPSTRMADGSIFYFADPKNQFVIFERNKQKFVFDLTAMTTPKIEPPPPKFNRMTFFVTSKGAGKGGHLEGLAGADRYCQSLADAAGAGDRTWRAYLSSSFEGQPTVNAGDRIGSGPWFNAKGVLVARGVADLHGQQLLSPEIALSEKGEIIQGSAPDPAHVDVLTGSNPNGTAAIGMDCDSWTSSGAGSAMIGRVGPEGGNGGSWNSVHAINSCSAKDFQSMAGDGRLYCFAPK